jgi:hypothetical protein
MKTKKKLELIQIQLEKIIQKAELLETEYADSLSAVHQVYQESALNLLHYLAFRSFDIGELQQRLRYLGLPDLANIEGHVMTSLQTYPAGIMVARGDLAIETGWENFATIQEEIMRLGEAAHIPVIWATQVLESLAKKGVPTRSEITDAALAQRAECVMLNKGPYIDKALKTLNEILVKMQNHQKKQQTMLPRLKDKDSDGLSLLHAEPEELTEES